MRFLAGLTAVLMLSACGSTDPQVAALQADPMADWLRDGIVERKVNVVEPGSSLGKPQYAGVHRILKVTDDSTFPDVLAELKDAAEEAGWTIEPTHRPDDFFSAERRLTADGEKLRAELSVGKQSDSPLEVFVALDGYPE